MLLLMPSVVDLFCSFVYFLVFMCSDPYGPFEQEDLGADMGIIAVGVDELERKLCEVHLKQSRGTGLVATW